MVSALAYSSNATEAVREEIPRMGIDEGISKVGNIAEGLSKKIPPIGPARTAQKESGQQCSGDTVCASEEVTRIVDGDTLYTKSYKIRLALTNTPEKDEPGYSEATAFTTLMCPVGSIAQIDQDDGQPTDVYGRMVAKVTCSGNNLNSAILGTGHGKILTQYCKKSEFSSEPWAKKYGC